MQWKPPRQKFTTMKLLPLSSGLYVVVLCYIFTVLAPTDIAAIPAKSHNSHIEGLTPPPFKCRNEQGNDVDWFIAYKLPKNRTSANPLVRGGVAYSYILPTNNVLDGNNKVVPVPNVSPPTKGSFSRGHDNAAKSAAGSTAWILSKKGIDSLDSMVGQTIGKLYMKDDKDVAFLTYNDQPPVGPTVNSGGHTKGIILSSLASGIWIQHSVPHFPLIGNNYQYPETGKNNGQVFHCISLPSVGDVDNLGKILEITRPHIVNFSFPTDSLKKSLPQLEAIVHRHRHDNSYDDHLDLRDNLINHLNGTEASPCVNEVDEKACLTEQMTSNGRIITANQQVNLTKKAWDLLEIRSANGKVIHAYAKGPSFNEDIYSAWIAPNYKTRLEVQSWLNGPHPYPSNCTPGNYDVYNIEVKNIGGQVFSTHNDHSKWAISTDQPLVCISDLNRMEHQLKRGGVALCFIDSATWMTFNRSVIEIQPCPRLFTTAVSVTRGRGEVQQLLPLSSSKFIINSTQITSLVPHDTSTKTHYAKGKIIRHRRHHHHDDGGEVKSRAFSFMAI